jgi:hypothetical protein
VKVGLLAHSLKKERERENDVNNTIIVNSWDDYNNEEDIVIFEKKRSTKQEP